MKLSLLLAIVLFSLACTESVKVSDNYLEVAAQHCHYPANRLGWLQTIASSGQYQKPNATVSAVIQQISLSSYEGGRVFLLDSPLNSCANCPWAILDCDGKPSISPSSLPLTRDRVIWTK